MTKQQLRESIRRIIKQELDETLFIPPTQLTYNTGYDDAKSGKPADMNYYRKDMELEKVHEAAPAPSKPATAPGTKEPPSKTPDKKEPRRPLGNPNVRPAPKAKATMKEAEMLKQVIKRFKSKKNA